MPNNPGCIGGGNLGEQIRIDNELTPATVAASAGGIAIDRRGYNAVVFHINAGAVGGSGVFSLKVQESDTTTDGDFTDAVVGTFGAVTAANLTASGQEREIIVDCRALKRYVRVYFTLASGTNMVLSGVCVLGAAADLPAA